MEKEKGVIEGKLKQTSFDKDEIRKKAGKAIAEIEEEQEFFINTFRLKFQGMKTQLEQLQQRAALNPNDRVAACEKRCFLLEEQICKLQDQIRALRRVSAHTC